MPANQIKITIDGADMTDDMLTWEFIFEDPRDSEKTDTTEFK